MNVSDKSYQELMETERERKQILVTQVYDAALEGNVNSLLNLLQEDPLILDRCIIQKSDHFLQSPLHVAANFGHLEFTKTLLELKPELAEKLDQSNRSSALHMAVTKGNLDIVKVLVAENTKMCFVKDQFGRNPVHIAATSGELDVLQWLVSSNPQAARERTSDGDTVFHLCVKYAQPSSLELLVRALEDYDVLNSKDSDGNTVLHLAVLAKQLQMIQYLLANPTMEKNAMNTNRLTAMDIWSRHNKGNDDEETCRALKGAEALRAEDVLVRQNSTSRYMINDWLDKERSALMIVASLIATMAFQVAVNPPGGTWQDGLLLNGLTSTNSTSTGNPQHMHIVGSSILASADSALYNRLLIWNTTGFLSSVSVIGLLISGLPCKRVFMFLFMAVMWLAITATTFTYSLSVNYVSQTLNQPNPSPIFNNENKEILIWYKVEISDIISGWLAVIGLLLLVHFNRAMSNPVKRFILSPIHNLVLWTASTFSDHRRARSGSPV